MDPYKVLGVSPSATDDEVKKAYRRLSRKYHPDANVNKSKQEQEAAEENFKKVQMAYDTIVKMRSGKVHPTVTAVTVITVDTVIAVHRVTMVAVITEIQVILVIPAATVDSVVTGGMPSDLEEAIQQTMPMKLVSGVMIRLHRDFVPQLIIQVQAATMRL